MASGFVGRVVGTQVLYFVVDSDSGAVLFAIATPCQKFDPKIFAFNVWFLVGVVGVVGHGSLGEFFVFGDGVWFLVGLVEGCFGEFFKTFGRGNIAGLNDEILNLHFAFAFFLPLSPLPFLDVGVHGCCWKKRVCFLGSEGAVYSLHEEK